MSEVPHELPRPAPTSGPGRDWRKSLLLFLLVVTGYCGLALSAPLQHRLGIFGNGVWFLDSYAILASSDANHQGLDPYAPNPLDVYMRRHSYSRWWFALAPLGLSREDNFLFGGLMVAAFIGTAVLLLAPRSMAELAWYLALLLSPPVMLAVNRANNDLVVFAILSAGVLLTGRGGGGRPAWLGGSLALATGLKFFPIVAAGAMVGLRPPRRALAWAAATSLLALVVFASIWTDFRKAEFPVPVGTYLFGAVVFWRNLGWMGRFPVLASLAVLAGVAAWLTLSGRTSELAKDEDPARTRERLAFLTGALLLLACFAAGISYAYRWVFGLWLAPWLWRQAWGQADGGRGRLAPRAAFVLLTVSLWMDGLYCAAANTFVGPMELTRLRQWEATWNLCAQPVVWLLMTLVAGWLGGALLEAARSGLGRAQSRPAG